MNLSPKRKQTMVNNNIVDSKPLNLEGLFIDYNKTSLFRIIIKYIVPCSSLATEIYTHLALVFTDQIIANSKNIVHPFRCNMKTLLIFFLALSFSGCQVMNELGCSASVSGYYGSNGNTKPRPNFNCNFYSR